MWDYAALSQVAKLEGGPEALVNKIYADGVSQGRAGMAAWVIGAFALGGLVAVGVLKGIDYIEKRQEEKAQKTKQELIDGIREYDLEQKRFSVSSVDNDKEETNEATQIRKESNYATVS